MIEIIDEFDLKLQADQEDSLRWQAREAAAAERGGAIIRERDALQRAHEARIRQQDEERRREVETWARAATAPLSHGCPVPRFLG